MSSTPAHCKGSPDFDPAVAIADDDAYQLALDALNTQNDLETAVRTWFRLPPRERDKYVYHAVASVSLEEVQRVVGVLCGGDGGDGENDKGKGKGKGGANAWYGWARGEDGGQLPPPLPSDIDGYISIFLPSTSTASALKTFTSNARKNSIRQLVAAHLASHRHLSASHPLAASLSIPKAKPTTLVPRNPYLDFWAWSSRVLGWCGPLPLPSSPPRTSSSRAATIPSHHILPVFMHHFACAIPTHEALSVLRVLASGRTIADIGSGSGYWTFMLRQYPNTPVTAVDNSQSLWRTTWIPDTVRSDGVRWLSRPENDGGRDMVLLLVYPIVGGGLAGGAEGGFTRELVSAYRGDTIAVVGTQNHNGYTGFRDMTMAEFMEREHNAWTKVVQLPLPSFAGKDEAMFVFQRGDRLSPKNGQKG